MTISRGDLDCAPVHLLQWHHEECPDCHPQHTPPQKSAETNQRPYSTHIFILFSQPYEYLESPECLVLAFHFLHDPAVNTVYRTNQPLNLWICILHNIYRYKKTSTIKWFSTFFSWMFFCSTKSMISQVRETFLWEKPNFKNCCLVSVGLYWKRSRSTYTQKINTKISIHNFGSALFNTDINDYDSQKVKNSIVT